MTDEDWGDELHNLTEEIISNWWEYDYEEWKGTYRDYQSEKWEEASIEAESKIAAKRYAEDAAATGQSTSPTEWIDYEDGV